MIEISIENFINSLPIVGIGMVGIFLIIGLMGVLTTIFQHIFKTSGK